MDEESAKISNMPLEDFKKKLETLEFHRLVKLYKYVCSIKGVCGYSQKYISKYNDCLEQIEIIEKTYPEVKVIL